MSPSFFFRDVESELGVLGCLQDRSGYCRMRNAASRALREATDAFLATLDRYTLADGAATGALHGVAAASTSPSGFARGGAKAGRCLVQPLRRAGIGASRQGPSSAPTDDGDRTQMRLGMKPTKAEQVCMDSLLEGTGFELAVPPRRESL